MKNFFGNLSKNRMLLIILFLSFLVTTSLANFGKSQQSRMEEEALKETINAPRSKPSPRHNPNLHGPEPEEERSVLTILKVIATIFIVFFSVLFFQEYAQDGTLLFIIAIILFLPFFKLLFGLGN